MKFGVQQSIILHAFSKLIFVSTFSNQFGLRREFEIFFTFNKQIMWLGKENQTMGTFFEGVAKWRIVSSIDIGDET